MGWQCYMRAISALSVRVLDADTGKRARSEITARNSRNQNRFLRVLRASEFHAEVTEGLSVLRV